MELPEDVISFFKRHGPAVVSTINQDGSIHCSAKGIVGIEKEGTVFVIDLYHKKTFENLQHDPRISITVMDVHSFMGYTLQGKAKIVPREEIKGHIIDAWEDKIIQRISSRLIKGVQTSAQSERHFEADLPAHPKYLIEVKVHNIIDLRPPRSR